ncbi:hypothetical protein SBA5_70150 [Candidatus Sulfotelmatomonas gaucii]|uniref:Uncharacterized protein n=1 Tax=Candidatus Sulfuritelmatomonas gaucii TaxID=2043161 RepID=A0A2N9M0S2_9BACT|nr:hypothetical protein SBA5_70150 [Candidatus Sulfotelmatomonas gaucii]
MQPFGGGGLAQDSRAEGRGPTHTGGRFSGAVQVPGAPMKLTPRPRGFRPETVCGSSLDQGPSLG